MLTILRIKILGFGFSRGGEGVKFCTYGTSTKFGLGSFGTSFISYSVVPSAFIRLLNLFYDGLSRPSTFSVL